MKVLITGSIQKITDKQIAKEVNKLVKSKWLKLPIIGVTGNRMGVDTATQKFFRDFQVPTKVIKTDWRPDIKDPDIREVQGVSYNANAITNVHEQMVKSNPTHCIIFQHRETLALSKLIKSLPKDCSIKVINY